LHIKLTFDDNSFKFLDPISGKVNSIIYPTPTPTAIKMSFYSGVNNRVYILLETGVICVYNIDKEQAVLIKMQHPSMVKVIICWSEFSIFEATFY
jgi:hypothetical protein